MKNISPDFIADPGEQLRKVLAFRKKLEAENIVGRTFADVEGFKTELDRHLRGTVKEGRLTEAVKEDSPGTETVSKEDFEKLKKEIADLRKQLSATPHEKDEQIRSEIAVLALAEQAAKMALDGKIEQARQMFAQAVTNTTNHRVLYLAYELYQRTGDLKSAEEMMRRSLAATDPDKPSSARAAALGNLGLIDKTRGNLDAAEDYLKQSLEIDRKIGRLEGQANQLANLGSIAEQRGNQAEARRVGTEARDLYAKIGMEPERKKVQGLLDRLDGK